MRKTWKLRLIWCVTAGAFIMFLPAVFKELAGVGSMTVRLALTVAIAGLCAWGLGGMLWLVFLVGD
jgi:hypothetical protein